MSRFDVNGDQLVKLEIEFNALGVAMDGPIAEKVLLAGAEQVRFDWDWVAGEHGYRKPGSSGRGTGKMIESIGYPEGVKSIPDGHRVDIYPQGERTRNGKKIRNAEIAFVLDALEKRKGQSGWIAEADDKDDEKVYPVMTAAFFE